MKRRLKVILMVSAAMLFTLASVFDISQFGQFWFGFWKNVSVIRVLLIIVGIAAAGFFLSLFLFRRRKYKERILLTLPIAFVFFSLADISNLAVNYYGLNEEYKMYLQQNIFNIAFIGTERLTNILPLHNTFWL